MAINLKKLKQVQESLNQGSIDLKRCSHGDNKWRIMPPPTEDSEVFYKVTGKHWFPNPDGGNDIPVLCVKTTFNQSCIGCETVRELMEDPLTKKKAKKILPKKSVYLNVVDMNEPSAGVQVAEVPQTVFSEILSYMLDPEYGDLTDPKSGSVITITKTGKGLNTEYSVRVARKPTAYPTPKGLKNLDEIITEPDEDFLQGLIDFHVRGVVPAKVEDTEEEEDFDDDEDYEDPVDKAVDESEDFPPDIKEEDLIESNKRRREAPSKGKDLRARMKKLKEDKERLKG